MASCKLCKREIQSDAAGNIYCCHGCEAVDQIISSMDLSGEELESKKTLLLEAVFSDDTHTPQTLEDKAYAQDLRLSVSGMVCPACSWIIHHSLDKQEGVIASSVNFISETASVQFNPMKVGRDKIEALIKRLGYDIREEESPQASFDYYGFGTGWFFAVNVMMLAFVVITAEYWDIPPAMKVLCSGLMAVFTLITMYFGAKDTLIKGFAQLRKMDFRMETLILISTITALVYSFYAMGYSFYSIYYLKSSATDTFKDQYFDVVCLLLMLVETGNLITASFYAKLRKRVYQLADCLPRKVKLEGDVEAYKLTVDLEPNERFHVDQNEIVPTDGILQGVAEFDFSLINGESVGVELKRGQFVGAGAKLLSPSCTLEVPRTGTSSLIQNIIDSTINAFSTNSEVTSTGDRISQVFVPLVVAIAVVSASVFTYLGEPQHGLITFMGVLIVACPCAFGIAEPLVLTLAVGKAKGIGVQVFNGNVLREKPTTIIFDKTGTLTTSVMTISGIHWFVDENKTDLDILASLESGIEHPVAKILCSLGEGVGLESRDVRVGRISGVYKGTTYICGKPAIFPGLELPEKIKGTSGTLVAFGDETNCRLIITLSDKIRPEVPELINYLRSEKIRLHICSGDHAAAVDRVAKELDIPAQSEMTPSDKQDFIRALQADGECVMMVGDGINDAQSLAAADFGLAVFSGQLPAQMSADAVFLTPSLESLGRIIHRMKIVRKRIRSNYIWAFAYNFVGISLALAGILTPKFCAIGMVFSNFLVIINSLRSDKA